MDSKLGKARGAKDSRRSSSCGRTPSGNPNPIDVYVGSRVRLRRTLLGLSQEKLAEAIGLTFQQVQKYERGANRMGASRLYDMSRVLDVPVSFFFDGMPDETKSMSPAQIRGLGEDPIMHSQGSSEMLDDRQTLELVRNYHRIRDPNVRKQVYDLARVLGGDAGVPAIAAE